MHSRRPDEGMGALISSIREQTSRLKKNLSTTKEQGQPPEHGHMKGFIDELLQDNKTFHDEVDAYRQVLEAAVLRCRETQRQLELERLKNARIATLESQLILERSKAQQARQRTQHLKSKYLEMADAVRTAVLDMDDGDVQGAVALQSLLSENKVLKDMLLMSREGEPDSEGSLPPVAEVEYLQVLQQYKQKKSNAQRSKSYSNPSKKGYLLTPGKGSGSPQDSSWDAFFKAKEKGQKSPPASSERYDQMEEPK